MTTTGDVIVYFELQQLVHRYAHLVDDADWDHLEEVFVHNAVCDFTDVDPTMPVLRGRDAIRDYFSQMEHPVAHVAVDLVTGPGTNEEERVLRSKMIAVLRGGKLLVGDYRDRAVRTPEGWRFAERRTMRPRVLGGQGKA